MQKKNKTILKPVITCETCRMNQKDRVAKEVFEEKVLAVLAQAQKNDMAGTRGEDGGGKAKRLLTRKILEKKGKGNTATNMVADRGRNPEVEVKIID